MEKVKMPFSSPVFHDGLNCTVRLGEEWKNKLKVGDEFIVETPEKTLTMEVTNIKVSKFSDLTEDDIKYEHEPSCRTLEGLKKEMREIYPNMTDDSVFTVVYFEVKV